MRLKDLVARVLFPYRPKDDKGLSLPGLGESRPHGHFREFTVPRRYQRGGVSVAGSAQARKRCPDGIIPCSGENIP